MEDIFLKIAVIEESEKVFKDSFKKIMQTLIVVIKTLLYMANIKK